jgi:uncharacterized protein involved in exopolysaccharide biosynthesis
MPEDPNKKTLRDLLRVGFRHRLLLVAGAAFFALVALVGASWWPLKYTAMARFERRADPASEDITRGKSESFDAKKLTLQNELIGTRAIEAAVDELEKARLLPPLPRGQDGSLTPEGRRVRQEIVRGLIDDLKVNFDVRSTEVDLVSVAFTDADPRLAQQLPNTLVVNYINRITERMVTNLTASRDFLQTKVTEASTRLTELTRKRIDFETKHAGMLPDNPGTLQQQVDMLSLEIDRLRRQQTLAKEKMDRLKLFVRPATVPEGAPASGASKGGTGAAAEAKPAPEAQDPVKMAIAAEQARAEYQKASAELARLEDQRLQYQRTLDESRTLMHMTENHPKIKALRKQIDDMAPQIAKSGERVAAAEKRLGEILGRETRGGVSVGSPAFDPGRREDMLLRDTLLTTELASAQSEYEITSGEIERLQKRLAALQDLQMQFGPVKQEYTQIQKEVNEQQAEVDRWQRRLTEVQMALAAEAAKHRTHLSQVELAQEQFRPSSPKLLYILALAIGGGLAFGAGLVFLTNTMDRSFTTTEEAAEYLSLPVFGTVGEILTARDQARLKLRRWALTPLVAVVVVAAIGLAGLNIVLWLNDRPAYEQWRHAPVSFVYTTVADKVAGLKDRM